MAMTRLLLLAPLLLAACDTRVRDADPAADQSIERAAIANESKAVDTIVADARLTALQNQVNRLEAEVSELKGGKQALDTELLAQRLSALEQRVYSAMPDTPAAQPAPTASATGDRSSSAKARSPSRPRPSPTATPRPSSGTAAPPRSERPRIED